MDKWKVLAMFLLVIIVVLSYIGIQNNENEYDFGELRIDKDKLGDISKVVGDEFILCHIKDNKCVGIRSMSDG